MKNALEFHLTIKIIFRMVKNKIYLSFIIIFIHYKKNNN